MAHNASCVYKMYFFRSWLFRYLYIFFEIVHWENKTIMATRKVWNNFYFHYIFSRFYFFPLVDRKHNWLNKSGNRIENNNDQLGKHARKNFR